MEVRVAHEHEAFRGRLGRQHPGLQRGKVDIVVPVGAVQAVMERHPVPLARRRPPSSRQPPGRRSGHGTASDSAPAERSRAAARRRAPARNSGSASTSCRPTVVASGNLDDRLLSVDQQLLGGPKPRHLLVAGDVLPVVAEILRGERLAIGPAVPRPQVEGELAVSPRCRRSRRCRERSRIFRCSRRGAHSRRRPACACRARSPRATAASRRAAPAPARRQAESPEAFRGPVP